MNFKVLEKKNKEKNKDYAIRNLKYNIVFLNLEPGDKISENQISKLLNLSRSPIREAFIELKNNLLLDIKPQIGSFISYLDIDTSKELLFFRSTLEQGAVAELCNKKSLSYLDEFKDIILKEKELHHTNDFQTLINLDNKFHDLIFKELNYENIPSIIANNTSYLSRMRILRLKANIRETNYIKEHEEILNYIVNNNGNEAGNLLKNHIIELIDDMLVLKEKYPNYFK